MIQSAMEKTHGLFHSYANKMVRNPKAYFAVAAAKSVVVTVAFLEYKKYKELYDKDTIQAGSHTSPVKSFAEDMLISALVALLSFFGLKCYLKYPSLHPKDEKSAGKEPEGSERTSDEKANDEKVDERPKTSRESRALVEGLLPTSRLGVRSTIALRT